MKNIGQYILNLIPSSSTPLNYRRSQLEHKIAAHALGEWNGQNYLNCREAFEANYAKGVRLFEADFAHSSDNKIVLLHDGHEETFGLKKNFTEAEFLSVKPFGATLLNLKGFVDQIIRYPDVIIITDVKDNNLVVLKAIVEEFKSKNLDYKKTIVPQIYHPSEFPAVNRLGFERIIFTVYRFRNMKNLTARFLRKTPQICALTVPDKWIEKKNYLRLIKQCQIDIYVHSINDEKRRDYLYSKGVKGIYTHSLF